MKISLIHKYAEGDIHGNIIAPFIHGLEINDIELLLRQYICIYNSSAFNLFTGICHRQANGKKGDLNIYRKQWFHSLIGSCDSAASDAIAEIRMMIVEYRLPLHDINLCLHYVSNG